MNAYYYLNLVERGIITAAEVYDALLYFRIRQRFEINETLGENQEELYRDDEEDYEKDDIAAWRYYANY